jgi:hypothetical protein
MAKRPIFLRKSAFSFYGSPRWTLLELFFRCRREEADLQRRMPAKKLAFQLASFGFHGINRPEDPFSRILCPSTLSTTIPQFP